MSIIDDYYTWLKNLSFLEQLNNDVARISLPFLDRNNDFTEIYIVKRSNNEYLLTDDGMTYSELEFSGFDFTQKKRVETLKKVANSHGVSIDSNNALFVVSDLDSLPQKKHMLVHCMMKISDMFESRGTSPKSFFIDDIAAFLNENDIRHTESISLIGKSKLPCHFDFVIPPSKAAPERLIRGINRLDTNAAKLLIFNWEDTRDTRNHESQLYAFVNDVDKDVKPSVISSLKEYSVVPIKWTERSTVVEPLIA